MRDKSKIKTQKGCFFDVGDAAVLVHDGGLFF